MTRYLCEVDGAADKCTLVNDERYPLLRPEKEKFAVAQRRRQNSAMRAECHHKRFDAENIYTAICDRRGISGGWVATSFFPPPSDYVPRMSLGQNCLSSGIRGFLRLGRDESIKSFLCDRKGQMTELFGNEISVRSLLKGNPATSLPYRIIPLLS